MKLRAHENVEHDRSADGAATELFYVGVRWVDGSDVKRVGPGGAAS
jgi:hypothetical protein